MFKEFSKFGMYTMLDLFKRSVFANLSSYFSWFLVLVFFFRPGNKSLKLLFLFLILQRSKYCTTVDETLCRSTSYVYQGPWLFSCFPSFVKMTNGGKINGQREWKAWVGYRFKIVAVHCSVKKMNYWIPHKVPDCIFHE